MAEKSISQVLAEALDYFMGTYWKDTTLGKAAGVAANTVGNAKKWERRTTKSGKPQSIKLVELDLIAKAMGLTIADLTTDASDADRRRILLRRAAEIYQQTGKLPEWAPDDKPEASRDRLDIPFANIKPAPPVEAPATAEKASNRGKPSSGSTPKRAGHAGRR